jgi:Uncharacterised nucleotidyltransferase
MDVTIMRDHEERRATWVRYEMGVNALRQVVDALGEARIDVLPVKGIVTAHQLYDDVADRPMSDIDVRIRRADFSRALDMGRARGWPIIEHTPRFWEGAFLLPGIMVELESTIGPPGLCSLTVDELLARASRIVGPFGFEHFEPELNDHALMLCINAFKDRLFALNRWALDDLTRIVRHSEFDATLVARRACVGGVATAVWIVADWLARELGADRWCEVRDRIGRTPPSPHFARAYRAVTRARLSPIAGICVTTAGGDGFQAKLRGLAMAGAGLVYGGVMRRIVRGGHQ